MREILSITKKDIEFEAVLAKIRPPTSNRFSTLRALIEFRRFLYPTQEVEILDIVEFNGDIFHVVGFYTWMSVVEKKVHTGYAARDSGNPFLAVVHSSELVPLRPSVISEWFEN